MNEQASDELRSQNWNIILIGMRGAGKTVVGRELATRLGWPFVDTDERITAKVGRPIAEVFANDGEEHFRDLEREAIADVLGTQRQVISVGGGAVLDGGNRERLHAGGKVIWLTASPDTLAERIATDPRSFDQRPRLTAADTPLDELRELYRTRRVAYIATSHHVINTAGRSVIDVVDAAVEWLEYQLDAAGSA